MREVANQLKARSNSEIAAALGENKHYTLTASENVAIIADHQLDFSKGKLGDYKLLATKIPETKLLEIFDHDGNGDVSIGERLKGDGGQKLIDLQQQLSKQLQEHYKDHPEDFKPVPAAQLSSWQQHGTSTGDKDLLQIDYSKLKTAAER